MDSYVNENHRQYGFLSNWGVNLGFPSYDSYSEFNNLGWRSHFNYWNQKEQLRHQPPPSLTQVAPQTPNSGMSLEDIVKSLALTTLQFQQDKKARLQETNAELQETRESIQLLGNQISQLPMTIDKIAIQASHELTLQTYANPIENVSAMTPQSGTELHMIEQALMKTKEDKKTLEDTEAQEILFQFLRLTFVFFLPPTECPN
ncbi:UNVERIFIED_CONTAM: hypothetical protein Sradi_3641400 [Sesamum radiatum]|uniref:Uncharacterized protein n=1 Tax=Sesamum radiatum TaxID=300843 RepID=A0AAW2QI82_SESRA